MRPTSIEVNRRKFEEVMRQLIMYFDDCVCCPEYFNCLDEGEGRPEMELAECVNKIVNSMKVKPP